MAVLLKSIGYLQKGQLGALYLMSLRHSLQIVCWWLQTRVGSLLSLSYSFAQIVHSSFSLIKLLLIFSFQLLNNCDYHILQCKRKRNIFPSKVVYLLLRIIHELSLEIKQCKGIVDEVVIEILIQKQKKVQSHLLFGKQPKLLHFPCAFA